MHTTAIPAASASVFRRPAVRETALLLLLAWAVPFCVHLIPWSGTRPLGVYLLPMFWTALVAAYFYGEVIGAVVAIFAPLLNLLITGLPAARHTGEAVLELAVFAVVLAWLIRRFPRWFVLAPIAYVIARFAWAEWQAVTDPQVAFTDVMAVVATIKRSLVNGASGLVVLIALHFALVRFYPKVPVAADAPREA